MADSSIFTKEEVATKDLLAGMIDSLTEMKFRLNGIDAPRIVSVETDRDGDNLCGGHIIVQMRSAKEAEQMRKRIEAIIHPLKHCFMGEHAKVPRWIIDEYRAKTEKHSRMAIMYIVAVKGSQVVVNYYRSMASGSSGAHRLVRHTDQNDGLPYALARYKEYFYYVVPMEPDEANRLMVLFGAMVVKILDKFFANQPEEESQLDLVETESAQSAEKTVLATPVLN